MNSILLWDNSNTVDFIGARLVLTSSPGLKLYFKGEGNFTVDGQSAQITKEGAYIVVTIDSVSSFERFYTIECDGFSLSYAMASYGKKALEGNNESLKNLIFAMIDYYMIFE